MTARSLSILAACAIALPAAGIAYSLDATARTRAELPKAAATIERACIQLYTEAPKPWCVEAPKPSGYVPPKP